MLTKGKFLALAICATACIAITPVNAATITVPTDYPTIKAALLATEPGDVVSVSPGTYYEFGLIMPTGVTLRGAGEKPGDAVIDARGLGRILLCESLDQTSAIENLTFLNGRAWGQSSYDRSGGAILFSNCSSRVSNCLFIGNQADAHGGAIRCNNSTPLIMRCQFELNIAVSGGGGALDCSYNSSPLVRNSEFIGNTASWGGAMACRGGAAPTITDCVFGENAAEGEVGYGGAVFADFLANPRFLRSTFYDNSANYGGALASFQLSEMTLDHCTIVANRATIQGAGIFCNFTSPQIDSSILAFQYGFGIESMGQSYPTFTCSDIFGNTRGDWTGSIAPQLFRDGNLSADPDFCWGIELEEADFSLSEASPCADAESACGVLGAWSVGCEVTSALIESFEVEWSGTAAMAYWQIDESKTYLQFKLTVERSREPGAETNLHYGHEGNGHFSAIAEDLNPGSGERFLFRLYLHLEDEQWQLLNIAELQGEAEWPVFRAVAASPNPFNPSTTIHFEMAEAQRIQVAVYDINGRLVAKLVDGWVEAGRQSIPWSGRNSNGSPVGSGIYLVVIHGQSESVTQKLTLLK